MFTWIKKMYQNFRYRNLTAQNEVYIVLRRMGDTSNRVELRSIHKTLESANKFYKKEVEKYPNTKQDMLSIERYGLWD